MVERPGESKRNESDKNNTSNRPADHLAAGSREAVGPQRQGNSKAAGDQEREARAFGSESSCGSARAGSVQTVQAGLGGDCRAGSKRARHAIRVPVLPKVASRSGARARIQENEARAMGPVAPSGGIGNRWHAH